MIICGCQINYFSGCRYYSDYFVFFFKSNLQKCYLRDPKCLIQSAVFLIVCRKPTLELIVKESLDSIDSFVFFFSWDKFTGMETSLVSLCRRKKTFFEWFYGPVPLIRSASARFPGSCAHQHPRLALLIFSRSVSLECGYVQRFKRDAGRSQSKTVLELRHTRNTRNADKLVSSFALHAVSALPLVSIPRPGATWKSSRTSRHLSALVTEPASNSGI